MVTLNNKENSRHREFINIGPLVKWMHLVLTPLHHLVFTSHQVNVAGATTENSAPLKDHLYSTVTEQNLFIFLWLFRQ